MDVAIYGNPHRDEPEAGQDLSPTILAMAALAQAYRWWARLRHGVDLGPNLGAVTGPLTPEDVASACPDELPPVDLMNDEIRSQAFDAGPSAAHRRANVWSHVLRQAIQRQESLAPPGTIRTTYGFVWLNGRLRLSVIHYLRPLAAFRAAPPRAIAIGHWTFPVVIRPWLGVHHGDYAGRDGNCWVKFPKAQGMGFGILTAGHAVVPPPGSTGSTQIGEKVCLDVGRPAPMGRLVLRSAIMDLAVVEVEGGLLGDRQPERPSTVVGYKPVRLLTARGPVDAQIVEHQGFTRGIFTGGPGQEPLTGAYVILNQGASPGDSGCLGLDREFAERNFEPPYLLYLGITNIGLGPRSGYGILLDQPRKVWGLEFYR